MEKSPTAGNSDIVPAVGSYANEQQKTMLRFWDPTLQTVEVRPTFISKLNTALQFGLVSATLLDHSFLKFINPEMYTTMWWTVGLTTIASGASYIGSKTSVKYFNRRGSR